MKKTNATKSKNKTKKSDVPKSKTPASKAAKKPEIAKKKSEEIMDRPTLIGIARLLKGAGSAVKALKSDTDEALQRKINEALQDLPSDEVVKQLGAIDPNKLVNVLKQDCFGIFVDFSDVSCVRCSDSTACVAGFLKNLKGGFTHLDKALPAAGDPKPNILPGEAKTKLVGASRYEPARLVFVRDVENPNPKGDEYHDTIQRVLDDQPETLSELRAIVEQDFDLEGDGDFMKFVTALRDPKEGVIKLDVDLSDKDKAALRGAGYDV